MSWPFAAGFSGVCARESKTSGAANSKKTANNRRVIFIRERILTLAIGVVGAQRPFARSGGQNCAPKKAESRLLFFFFLLFLQDGGRGDGVAIFEPQQANTLCRAARFADFVGVHADHFSVVRNDHDVGFFRYLQRGHDRAVAVRSLPVYDALTAARRDAVLRQRR